MGIRYYINPVTGLPHIYDHGVTEDEVDWILARPGEDGHSSGGTRQSTGKTAGGRYLRVIYVPDLVGHDVFVVTAYELSGNPLRAYRRRKRRRRR
jgi:hypothetical protein